MQSLTKKPLGGKIYWIQPLLFSSSSVFYLPRFPTPTLLCLSEYLLYASPHIADFPHHFSTFLLCARGDQLCCASQALLIPARWLGARWVQAPSCQVTLPKAPVSSAGLRSPIPLHVCGDESALWTGSGCQAPIWPSGLYAIS